MLADRYIYTALARDAVRGVDRDWVEELYSFAVHPDLTFYFRVPLECSLSRILEGRPALKYHEAGLDMGWSTDPYESFRLFQGKVFAEYESMREKFGFTAVDATEEIHVQQSKVRNLIREKIASVLPAYRRRRISPPKEKIFFGRHLLRKFTRPRKFAGKLFCHRGAPTGRAARHRSPC